MANVIDSYLLSALIKTRKILFFSSFCWLFSINFFQASLRTLRDLSLLEWLQHSFAHFLGSFRGLKVCSLYCYIWCYFWVTWLLLGRCLHSLLELDYQASAACRPYKGSPCSTRYISALEWRWLELQVPIKLSPWVYWEIFLGHLWTLEASPIGQGRSLCNSVRKISRAGEHSCCPLSGSCSVALLVWTLFQVYHLSKIEKLVSL